MSTRYLSNPFFGGVRWLIMAGRSQLPELHSGRRNGKLFQQVAATSISISAQPVTAIVAFRPLMAEARNALLRIPAYSLPALLSRIIRA